MSERIETLDTAPYHTVIIKNSKGTILFGNPTLEEYIKLNSPDLSNYSTKEYVNNLIGNINTELATLTTISEVSK